MVVEYPPTNCKSHQEFVDFVSPWQPSKVLVETNNTESKSALSPSGTKVTIVSTYAYF